MQSKHIAFLFTTIVLLFTALTLSSCEDEKKTDPPMNTETLPGITFSGSGTLSINMSYYFGDSMLKFSPTKYITKAGDTITITDLLYYMSNVSLIKEDGSVWNAKNYNLMDASNPKQITIVGVPAGNYKKVSFAIGVDTPYNHSLDHPYIDALDPAHGMSWGWSTGYIFTRLKGYHAQQSGFSFDLGGDSQYYTVQYDLSPYKLKAVTFQAEVKVNVKEFFENPNTYNLKTQTTAIHTPTDPEVTLLVENMKNGMFEFTSIK